MPLTVDGYVHRHDHLSNDLVDGVGYGIEVVEVIRRDPDLGHGVCGAPHVEPNFTPSALQSSEQSQLVLGSEGPARLM